MAKKTTDDSSDYVDEEDDDDDDSDDFAYAANEDVYVCKECGTHLSLKRQLIYAKVANKSYHAVFENLVNIRYDHWNLIPASKQCPAQKIYCQVCNMDLGFKWVKVKNPQNSKNAGRFLVFLEKMMLRQDGEFCNAVTERPYHINALRNQLKSEKDAEDVFECHRCATHIAPHNSWIRRYFENCSWYTLFGYLYDFFTQFCYIYKNNIIYAETEITNSKSTAQCVFCKTCYAYLGFKLIKVAEPDDDIQDGTFLLFTHRLLLLKGGKICNAVTGQPYKDASQPQNEQTKQQEQIIGVPLDSESSAKAGRAILNATGWPDAPATDKQENSVTSSDVGGAEKKKKITLKIKLSQKSMISVTIKRRLQILKLKQIRAVFRNKRKNQPNLWRTNPMYFLK